MSNLKKKLNKTAAINSEMVKAKLEQIVKEVIDKAAAGIGWEDGSDGVVELVDPIIQSEFGFDIAKMAEAICYSVEIWAEETKENYPNGAE
jgi:hypothetical protein